MWYIIAVIDLLIIFGVPALDMITNGLSYKDNWKAIYKFEFRKDD